jgi:hypothetical protein
MAFNPGNGGGISTAADVSLNNPQTNHSFVYDGNVQKWTNKSQFDTTHVTAKNITSAYTLTLDDDGKAVEVSVTSATNLTVPSSSVANIPIGSVIEVVQAGVGQVILVPAGGVTLRTSSSLTTRQQWSTIGIRKRATDEWIVTGDLA